MGFQGTTKGSRMWMHDGMVRKALWAEEKMLEGIGLMGFLGSNKGSMPWMCDGMVR